MGPRPARYLIDLSAWARAARPGARRRWTSLMESGRLVCHPVFALELLHTAPNRVEFASLASDLTRGFEWVRPDEDTMPLALDLQRRMAGRSPAGQRVKTPDLLTAALAEQHGLGIVHSDRDYDAIKDHAGAAYDSEWLAPPGSLDRGAEAPTSLRREYRRAFGERMGQLRSGADLEVWPDLIAWLDDRLRERAPAARHRTPRAVNTPTGRRV